MTNINAKTKENVKSSEDGKKEPISGSKAFDRKMERHKDKIDAFSVKKSGLTPASPLKMDR